MARITTQLLALLLLVLTAVAANAAETVAIATSDSAPRAEADNSASAQFDAMEVDLDRRRTDSGGTPGLALAYVILGDGRFDYAGDTAGAFSAYDKALTIYRSFDGETNGNVAFVYDHIGRVHRILAQYAAARPWFERSLAIRRVVLGETDPGIARSHQSLGLVSRAQGDLVAALDHYQRALAITIANGAETGLAMVTSVNNIGSVQEDRGEYDAALASFRRALAIIRQMPGDTRLDEATLQNNLGHVQRARGEHAQARNHYQAAVAGYRGLYGPFNSSVADGMDALALLDADAGDYSRAMEQAEQALYIRRQVLPANHPDIGYSHNTIAFIHHYLKEYDSAIASYSRGLAILRQVYGETHPEIATISNNLGTIHQDQGDTLAAEECYRRSLEIRRLAFGEMHPQVSTSYNNLAMLALEDRNLDSAEDGFRRALAIRASMLGDRHPDIAAIHHNLSEVHRLRGDTPAWMASVRAAVEASRLLPEPWDGRVATLRHTPSSVWYLYILSWAEATDTRVSRREALTRAVGTMDTALGLLARLRSAVSRESRLLHEKRLRELPAWALSLKSQLRAAGGGPASAEGALVAAEIASAWSFLEMLADARIGAVGSPPPALAAEENGLVERLARLEARAGEPGADRERVAAEEEFEEFIQRLHWTAPRFAALRYPRPATVASLRTVLAPDEAAVEYVHTQDGAFVVVVTTDSCVLVDLGSPTTLDSAIRAARIDLTSVTARSRGERTRGVAVRTARARVSRARASRTRGGTDTASVPTSTTAPAVDPLAELDSRLLRPIAGLITGKRLIIVPGSSLEGVAFGALRTPSDRWRIDEHEIVYAPSLAVFTLLRGLAGEEEPHHFSRMLLALGNPAYEGRPDPAASRSLQRFGAERGTWGALPASGAEARAIAQFFPQDSRLVLVGAAAAEGRIEAESWTEARYLHFACHGALEEGPGREPALVLSLSGNRAPADGFLTLSEVARRQVDAELVVLSACNSGRSGSQRPATGVSSLSRAFLLAGADAVVVSLWPVGDEAAARLMVEFYRRMRREGMPPGAALRAASIALRDRLGMTAPAQWAPFILMGGQAATLLPLGDEAR